MDSAESQINSDENKIDIQRSGRQKVKGKAEWPKDGETDSRKIDIFGEDGQILWWNQKE